MAEVGLLEHLSLNNWYKYLLYLAGIILILGIYFQIQYAIGNPSTKTPSAIMGWLKIAVATIILGTLLWLVDSIIDYVGRYYYAEGDFYSDALADKDEKLEMYKKLLKKNKKLLIIKFVIQGIFLVIWILIFV